MPSSAAVQIAVGGWEHDCCGPEYRLFERVTLEYWVERDGSRFETHHYSGEDGVDSDPHPPEQVSGTIVEILFVDSDGARIPVRRVPSGTELMMLPEDEAIALDRVAGGEPAILTREQEETFLLTIEPRP